MFRPARLLLIGAVALLVYSLFYALPPGDPRQGAFDPDKVALHEAETWKAIHTHEDLSIYVSAIFMERELHRLSWFRALQAGYYTGHAMTSFVGLTTRFERVLPDLQDAAQIQKDWTDATFEPSLVARAELNWWVTRKNPSLNTLDAVSSLMAEAYAIRYRVDASHAIEAATLRAEAAALRDEGGKDPDWPRITKLLSDSYRALGTAIKQTEITQRARR